MSLMPNLQTALTDVLYETKDDALRLIIGGQVNEFLAALHELFDVE